MIGVEEELMLINPQTGRPVAVASEIFAHLEFASEQAKILSTNDGASVPALEQEVKQEQIEVVSPPLKTYNELLDSIRRGRQQADESARLVGARAFASATAGPTCFPHPVTNGRYNAMRRRFGVTFDEQLTCGLHVHVSIESADEGVAVLDRIRPWLPVILALSANSPFWQGKDTQYASYRYQAWGRWPSAGPYEIFGSVDSYARAVDDLLATGVPLDEGMIYFDARLSSHAPTVEIRVADVCFEPEDAARLAIVIRALVETAAREWRAGVEPDRVPVSLLRAASWRASRYGTAEMLVDPQSGRTQPARAVLHALLDHTRGGFADADEIAKAAALFEDVLRRGTGADEQRRSGFGLRLAPSTLHA